MLATVLIILAQLLLGMSDKQELHASLARFTDVLVGWGCDRAM
jgi:uncharacterized membrane protein YozB (DUF420 family)